MADWSIWTRLSCNSIRFAPVRGDSDLSAIPTAEGLGDAWRDDADHPQHPAARFRADDDAGIWPISSLMKQALDRGEQRLLRLMTKRMGVRPYQAQQDRGALPMG